VFRRAKNRRGFTLVETILTIVVVGIIAGVSAKILVSGLDTYAFITNRKDLTQHARVAMERMVNELTVARWNDITWMSGTHIGFIDRGGSSTSFKSKTFNNIPSIARGNDFLAGQLGFLDFDYLQYDGSNAWLNFQLKRINIELSLDALGGYGSLTLRTEVFPRNEMYDNFERIN